MFRSKEVIWVKVPNPSIQRKNWDEEFSTIIRWANLNLIKGDKEFAQIKEEAIKYKIAQKYNHHVSL